MDDSLLGNRMRDSVASIDETAGNLLRGKR